MDDRPLSSELDRMLGTVCRAIADKKGIEPALLDLRGLSSVTDFFVIVTGGSPPHLKALVAELQQQVEKVAPLRTRLEGTPESGWMVLDLGDAVVHVFLPEVRRYYALETLWNDAPRWPVDRWLGDGARPGG